VGSCAVLSSYCVGVAPLCSSEGCMCYFDSGGEGLRGSLSRRKAGGLLLLR
jgi:hypothetical protein